MATAEFPMWVTKKADELNGRLGFVMVPADLRDAAIAGGFASDTFDFRAVPDWGGTSAPIVPPEPEPEPEALTTRKVASK
jgi:hypothetical protein